MANKAIRGGPRNKTILLEKKKKKKTTPHSCNIVHSGASPLNRAESTEGKVESKSLKLPSGRFIGRMVKCMKYDKMYRYFLTGAIFNTRETRRTDLYEIVK